MSQFVIKDFLALSYCAAYRRGVILFFNFLKYLSHEKIKQFFPFFSLKNVRSIFTIGFLLMFGISLNGQDCECLEQPTGPFITVGGSGAPTLSSAASFFFDPTQPLIGGCVVVNGTFTIDLDWDVSDTEFVMDHGAEIIVNDVSVTIDESNIHGCEVLWRSITLSDPSSSLALTNSEIRDGEYAINLPVSGASLIIQDNDFISNYVGIYSPPNSPNQLKQFMVDTLNPIIGNTFRKANVLDLLPSIDLLPHYDPGTNVGLFPFAGAEMHDCTLFTIGEIDGTGHNTFDSLRYGIIFRNTAFNIVGGADITRLLGESIGVETITSNQSQNQIRNCFMDSLRMGVNGINTGTLILQNDIAAFETGVRLANCNNYQNVITLNEISSDLNGINTVNINNNMDDSDLQIINNDVDAFRGIRLFSVTGRATVDTNMVNIFGNGANSGTGLIAELSNGEIRVVNNKFHFDDVVNNLGLGIRVDDSQTIQFVDNLITTIPGNDRLGNGFRVTSSPNNLFCCNEINNTNVASNFFDPCLNTRYRTTTYGTNNIGLRLVNSAIGFQDHPGNNFSGGTLNRDAVFIGDPLNTIFSFIETDESLMTDSYSNIAVINSLTGLLENPETWFLLNSEGDSTCQETPNCGETLYSFQGNPGEGYQLTPTDIEIAKFNTYVDTDGQLFKWEIQSFLYEKLKKTPSLITLDTDVNNFYNQVSTGKINNFYQVSNGINSLFIPSNSQVTNLSDLTNEIKSLSSELESILQELSTATGIDKLTLEQARKTKLKSLNKKIEDAADIRNQIKQQQLQEADFLLSINQHLEPEYVYQSNEKITNQIFLETIGHDVYEFTTHQQKIINGIANQCVTEGGKGVVRARALQQLYMIKDYADDHGCGSNSNARIGNTEKQKITIYPNPSIGEFSIQFEYPIEESLELELYDLNGKLLFQDQLYRGEFNYSFQKINLESGVYICKLKSSIGDVLTRKIVVNKI